MLEVRYVSKSYEAQSALVDVSLDVGAGEIVALLGRNGAGKTTLVSIVAGLRAADGGDVRIGGIDANASPRRAHAGVGFAPQDTGVYPTLTCRQNLRLFAGLAGHSRRDAPAAIDHLADALDLDGLLDRRVQELSGGERRRLHTAIALMGRPKLVLLDEPTVGADVQTRAQLLAFVRHLADEGTAVVYSTHYLAEIEPLDASIVILDCGRVVTRGTIAEIVTRHAGGAVDLTEPNLESAFLELTGAGASPAASGLGDVA